METVTHSGIEVDRCTGCQGLWFDLLEHERLTRLEDSDRIDTGDTRVGAIWDRFGRIRCPVCSTQMIRMVDARQPHIRYEACQTCSGVFMDAGEFTDYRYDTLLDLFKGAIAALRGD